MKVVSEVGYFILEIGIVDSETPNDDLEPGLQREEAKGRTGETCCFGVVVLR